MPKKPLTVGKMRIELARQKLARAKEKPSPEQLARQQRTLIEHGDGRSGRNTVRDLAERSSPM